MKFMKLGTKPDSFLSKGDNVRFVENKYLPLCISLIMLKQCFF
jgi:hypothetical protein